MNQNEMADTASAPKHEIDQWMAELTDAGWQRLGWSVWADPDGRMYRGPYGAWVQLQLRKSMKTGPKVDNAHRAE